MNPTYRFRLVVGNNSRAVYPVWNNELAINFEKPSNDQYFRQKIVGNLTFLRADYDYIVTSAFDTQFKLYIDISRNAGVSWTQYWAGQFYKTDCKFDSGNRNVVVTPETLDVYNDVLAGIEKEYNIVDLPVEMINVRITKRAMIQIYVPGDTVISCFLSGMNWEQEIDPISNEGDLQSMYHFGRISGSEAIVVSGATSPSDINGNYTSLANMNGYSVVSRMEERPFPDDPDYTTFYYVQEVQKNGVVYWTWESQTGYNYDDVTYTPVSGVAEGNLHVVRTSTSVYGRWVFDNPDPHNKTAYPILSNDPVYNNRNYRFVFPYVPIETVIFFGTQFTSTPNKYGIYQPGQYYVPPTVNYGTPIPVARSTWATQSVWFRPPTTDWNEERSLWNKYIMGNAYPIEAVISALLAQVAPNISHAGTVAYSQFLYGTNPLGGSDYHLFITPKSNILKGNYSEPAQRALITLKQVTDLLRDCFRCFWWIDSNNRFRIEHISYFMRGGSYSATPIIGRDLTTELLPRNGKSWATGQDAYSFNKIDMPERYQFGWMDKVTDIFEGGALDIISGYVEKGKIENIQIPNFTSDVDYMLLNPSGCSNDGFALMSYAPLDPGVVGGGATQLYSGSSPLQATFNPDAFGVGCDLRLRVSDLTSTMGATVRFLSNGVSVFSQSLEFDVIMDYTYTLNTPAGVDTMEISWASGGSGMVALVSLTPLSQNIIELPFVMFMQDNNVIRCQNGNMSFRALQSNYMYDMPAPSVRRNGAAMTVYGTKRLKTNTVNYPSNTDPNLYELVKTNIGNGQISKLSVNLSSRNANATLMYDTE